MGKTRFSRSMTKHSGCFPLNRWRHQLECPCAKLSPKWPNSRSQVSHLRTRSIVRNDISRFRTFVGNVIFSTFLNMQRGNATEVVWLLPVSVLTYLHERTSRIALLRRYEMATAIKRSHDTPVCDQSQTLMGVTSHKATGFFDTNVR